MSFSALQGAFLEINHNGSSMNDGLPVSVKWNEHSIEIIPTKKAPRDLQHLHIRRNSLQGTVQVTVAQNGAYVFTSFGESSFSTDGVTALARKFLPNL